MASEKHKKYKDKYGKSERFWGLGIEEETYFLFTKPIWVAASIARTAHKPERYSVDYYKTFKPCYKEDIAAHFTDASGFFALPAFFNGHSFTKMDLSGNHEKTYEKISKPNPKFHAPALFTQLQIWKPEYFKDEYEKSFTFDGDTIEFMTQNFYRANAKSVIKELISHKTTFLKNLNKFVLEKGIFHEKGTFQYPTANPGWAVFNSNPSNILMFNNGTYHINITLPSLLDNNSELLFPDLFRRQHQSVIRIYQWLEPLLLAEYGTPDPLSAYSEKYAKGSQRCAVSRYIGVGTFDSETMPEGKILQTSIKEIAAAKYPWWWYNTYHKESAYIPFDKIGLDINYRKHYQHGIELRFFDWFPEERLGELIELLILAAECASQTNFKWNCAQSESWNEIVIGVFRKGKDYSLEKSQFTCYEKVFGLPLLESCYTVNDLLKHIHKFLKKKFRDSKLVKMFMN